METLHRSRAIVQAQSLGSEGSGELSLTGVRVMPVGVPCSDRGSLCAVARPQRPLPGVFARSAPATSPTTDLQFLCVVFSDRTSPALPGPDWGDAGCVQIILL